MMKVGSTIAKILEMDNINASIEEHHKQIYQLKNKKKVFEDHLNKLSKVVD